MRRYDSPVVLLWYVLIEKALAGRVSLQRLHFFSRGMSPARIWAYLKYRDA
jgi:hypothetical protein